MVEAKAIWTDHDRFVGDASSGHAVVMDVGEKKTACTPKELLLIGLCGCTAYDVVNILRKKREPFSRLEVSAKSESAPHPPAVFTEIKLVYRVGGKPSRKAVEDAVKLSEEKYCSVAAMLGKTARISYHIEYLD